LQELKTGITAIQVDIKNDGLSYDIIEEAFERTLKARTMIIDDIMNKAIEAPRKNVSEYAPKIEKVQISVDGSKNYLYRDIISLDTFFEREITK